ncbi:hypothetical protein ACE7GA_25255 [Roseomonas sp. CCTCC AB2023176]|uniref:hypothetical protein n=1 Tax=Roseomonas sp. CCTCC AB2023176 TaxID=3342640 RepID=UPI0035D75F7F
MRQAFRAGVLGALLAFGSLAAPAWAQRAGLYDVTGTNPDGTPYSGVLQLAPAGLAAWQIAWNIEGNRFAGYGMSAGNTFAAGFTLGQRPGLGIYTVSEDGVLTGQWTLIGSSAIGTETLTPRN